MVDGERFPEDRGFRHLPRIKTAEAHLHRARLDARTVEQALRGAGGAYSKSDSIFAPHEPHRWLAGGGLFLKPHDGQTMVLGAMALVPPAQV